MVKSRKINRTKRRHSGGSQGSGYEPGGALTPGVENGLMVNRSYDACMSAARPGQLHYSASSGLPGISGISGILGMRGGAYTNNLTQNHGGFAQIDKIACTPNHMNPMNQHGGVGMVAAKDMGVYEAPTARYTTEPSQFTSSVGAPILLNRPLDAAAWSRSCTQTAGRRKNYKKSRKNKARKSNKSRKH